MAADAEQRFVVEELACRRRDECLAGREERHREAHRVSSLGPSPTASHGVLLKPRASSRRTAVTVAPNVSANVGLSMNDAPLSSVNTTRMPAILTAKLGRETNPAARTCFRDANALIAAAAPALANTRPSAIA